MKKLSKRIISVLLSLTVCLSLLTVVAFADNGAYVVTVFNERNGLPTGEANEVLQTSDGYIWIGSYGGLVRYDGSQFRNYSTEKAIESCSIRSLFQDSSGRLWIGTNDIGVYYYFDGIFTKIEGTDNNDFLCIRDFAEDNDGNIYCASNSGIASIIGDKIVPINDDQVSGITVYAVSFDKYGRMWGTLGTGNCFVMDEDKIITTLTADIFFDGLDIYSLAIDDNGVIYLGSSENKIAKIVLTDKSLVKSSFNIETIITGDVSTHNRLRITTDNKLLICGLRGFGVLDTDGTLQQFTEKQNAVSINSAAYDYEGNYWIASSAYGVVKYTMGCFNTINDKAEGLFDITVNTVAKQNESFYIGHDNGLIIYDSSWNSVSNELTELLDGVRIRHILADSKNNIWIATYSDNAVICYNTQNSEITSFNTDKGLTVNRARVLYEMKDGTIVAGTQEGVNVIKDGKVTATYSSEQGLTTLQILSLYETPDGKILAGSDGGGIYEIDGDKVTTYAFDNGLEEGVVLRITGDIDNPGAYFISAGSSLYYFADGRFRKLDNLVKGPGSIFDFYDKDGKLWILQNNGIFYTDKEKLLNGETEVSTTHGFNHGLTGTLNANTWHYTDEDGTIYLATRSGVSTFDFVSNHHKLPNIRINDVSVDADIFEQPSTINMKGFEKRITINFAALSYTDTTEMSIAYRLEGFESNETIISDSKSGSVSYTNLPGGTYKFTLRLFDPVNPDDFTTTEIIIDKEKMIYEYSFFIPLVVILVILITVLIVMLISRRKLANFKARQNELRSIVKQSLETLARTIDAKDKYTNGHSMRVAAYSKELSARMGMDEEEQDNIYYIALMHDIGKIGIPDYILNKPEKLTDAEYTVIKTHPAIGGEILKNFTALQGTAQGAKYHHERFDGKGYCEQLAGTDIPLVARIIGIADAYDAMSSDRCYRTALSSERIEQELKNGSGSQFDPEIVPYMLQMIKDGAAPIKHDESQCLPPFDNIG